MKQALALFHDAGEHHDAARLTARLGDVAWRRGELDAALERMERAWSELGGDLPDADVATLAAQIARLHIFKGDWAGASPHLDTALELAESLSLPDVLAETLTSMSVVASFLAPTHAEALVEGRRSSSRSSTNCPPRRSGPYNNLGDTLPPTSTAAKKQRSSLEQGIAYARRVGDHTWEQTLLGELSWSLALTGRWREALNLLDQIPEERLSR